MYKSIMTLALLAASLTVHAFPLGVGNVLGDLAAQSGTRSTLGSVDEVLLQLSAEINKRMPVSVDKHTRLDRVSAQPGRHLTYHYTIIDRTVPGESNIDFAKAVKPQLKNQLCTGDAQKFLKNGITISYLYTDKGGNQLGGAEFAPDDCEVQ